MATMQEHCEAAIKVGWPEAPFSPGQSLMKFINRHIMKKYLCYMNSLIKGGQPSHVLENKTTVQSQFVIH